jgi:hypothetical protein
LSKNIKNKGYNISGDLNLTPIHNQNNYNQIHAGIYTVGGENHIHNVKTTYYKDGSYHTVIDYALHNQLKPIK